MITTKKNVIDDVNDTNIFSLNIFILKYKPSSSIKFLTLKLGLCLVLFST